MATDEFSIPAELLKAWPDPATVRRQILELYSDATGRALAAPEASEAELRNVVTWMNQNAADFLPHLFRRAEVAVPKYSASLSAKISALDQFHCPICATLEDIGPSSTLRVRMPPESKQALKKKKKKGMTNALAKALCARFAGSTAALPVDLSICLMIVFVVSHARPTKDLDNMAKATIDAVKGVLFGDDRQIDHLNILRIESPDEEFFSLNLRPTTLNSRNDRLLPGLAHDWAGASLIKLSDYL